MKQCFLFSLLLLSICSSAQFLQEVGGKPYMAKGMDEYQGSPLLFQSWVKATATAANGKTFPGMLVNLDLSEDMPLFMRDGKVYTFSDKINELTISDSVNAITFKRGKLIDPSLPDVLMEVICDSPLLLKKHERQLVESVSYGSSSKSYRYTEGKVYYGLVKGEYKKIALNEDNAGEIFGKKWKDVKSYAKKNKLSFKTETGWRQLVKFYQSN